MSGGKAGHQRLIFNVLSTEKVSKSFRKILKKCFHWSGVGHVTVPDRHYGQGKGCPLPWSDLNLGVSPLPESKVGLALLYSVDLRLGKDWVTTRTLSAVTRKRGPKNMVFTSGLPSSS